MKSGSLNYSSPIPNFLEQHARLSLLTYKDDGVNLQSWTKVLGTLPQYSCFSVISRFRLKTVYPFRNSLAVLPPPHPIQS